jgi:hypothetical protein
MGDLKASPSLAGIGIRLRAHSTCLFCQIRGQSHKLKLSFGQLLVFISQIVPIGAMHCAKQQVA